MFISIMADSIPSKSRRIQHHKDGSVRLMEKRRLGTCVFADRVAQLSIDTFHATVPRTWRDEHPHTCISTIVAHFPPESSSVQEGADERGSMGHLQVMALGVGTKFLSETTLREQVEGTSYGTRIRDCHAEVLARRAFRRQITMEVMTWIQRQDDNLTTIYPDTYRPILQRRMPMHNDDDDDSNNNTPTFIHSFQIKPGITLHMYTSSAPCGNASLKKFATMMKETFMDHLGDDEWPSRSLSHELIMGHAISQGQFALLVKKQHTVPLYPKMESFNSITPDHTKDDLLITTNTPSTVHNTNNNNNNKNNNSNHDDWCPPGTSTVTCNHGSIHTCSDKICRWNYLGLQGSLLSLVLNQPLYLEGFIVGRKFTRSICQRAICCRAEEGAYPVSKNQKRRRNMQQWRATMKKEQQHVHHDRKPFHFKLNHPSIMCTSVYLHGDQLMTMSGTIREGNDARFGSKYCWAWWPSRETTTLDSCHDSTTTTSTNNLVHQVHAECIDGDSGFSTIYTTTSSYPTEFSLSQICTSALTQLFLLVIDGRIDIPSDALYNNPRLVSNTLQQKNVSTFTLKELRSLKRSMSKDYEEEKDKFLGKHRIFRQWRRREYMILTTELDTCTLKNKLKDESF